MDMWCNLYTTPHHATTRGTGRMPTSPASPPEEGTLQPIFVSVKEAARVLSISPWACYQLLNEGEIESRYKGSRRLVVVSSLLRYADNLPTERPDPDAEGAAS